MTEYTFVWPRSRRGKIHIKNPLRKSVTLCGSSVGERWQESKYGGGYSACKRCMVFVRVK